MMRKKQVAIVGSLLAAAALLYVGLLHGKHRGSADAPMYFFRGANMSDVVAIVHDRRLRLGVGGNRAQIIDDFAGDGGGKAAAAPSSAASVRLPASGANVPQAAEDADRVGQDTPFAAGADALGSVASAGKGRDIEKLSVIRKMMEFAWSNYEKYAWGQNEVAPMSGLSSEGAISGTAIGLTIVDSLDTLHIMGMAGEIQRAKRWCVEQLPRRLETPVDVSAFEFNIRILGGFLSMYALTGEQEYKELATLAAKKLMPVFRSPSGIPYSRVNLQTGATGVWHWASGAILAEAGSYHLEFTYLSRILAGDLEGGLQYRNAVQRIRDALDEAPKIRKGIYTNFVSTETGQFTVDQTASLGALGDSFYEYLLKAWLLSGKTDRQAKRMYYDAIQAMRDNDIIRQSPGGLTYAGIFRSGYIEEKMEHLTCFSGGLVALGAKDAADPSDHMRLAEALALTCRESYHRAATGLGPEAFYFMKNYPEATSSGQSTRQYMLRPELVETYFVLWRLTHNPKYRAWAWDVVQALQKYARVEHGFASINDVYEAKRVVRDDSQPSYFLAETLKYLYLTFEDDDVLPLDRWVFNTEAHPFPVAPRVTLAARNPPSGSQPPPPPSS